MQMIERLAAMEVSDRKYLPLLPPGTGVSIYRVEGKAVNEFTRTGKSRAIGDYTTYEMVAFEVTCRVGGASDTRRFGKKYEAVNYAKAWATMHNLQERSVMIVHS